MAQLFKEAGYTTGHFGKWHLGEGKGYEPTDRGYDDAAWSGNYYNDNPQIRGEARTTRRQQRSHRGLRPGFHQEGRQGEAAVLHHSLVR